VGVVKIGLFLTQLELKIEGSSKFRHYCSLPGAFVEFVKWPPSSWQTPAHTEHSILRSLLAGLALFLCVLCCILLNLLPSTCHIQSRGSSLYGNWYLFRLLRPKNNYRTRKTSVGFVGRLDSHVPTSTYSMELPLRNIFGICRRALTLYSAWGSRHMADFLLLLDKRKYKQGS